MEPTLVSSLELYNLLQAQKNWPSGGPPVLLDARSATAYSKRMIRGARSGAVTPEGTISVSGAPRCWWDQTVCVYGDAEEGAPEENALLSVLSRDGQARGLLLLTEPFASFRKAYPFLTARGDSSKASKRPAYPSCIVPDLLYLGDLADASALSSLRELLNVQMCVTALAELTPGLKESVAESKIRHTWCNVRDVEGADIKEHFTTVYDLVEEAREHGTAVFVHCSRGVSRSASLCMAYLMRKERWSARAARDYVEARRPIVMPNEGFWRCLQEQEKEWSGERSGVYAPAVTKTRIEDLEFELPPPWAAEPMQSAATLQVEKAGEALERLPVGEHSMYTFGRSLTCDFQIEHPSASRMHAALVHHEKGSLYLIDLKSSHCTYVDKKPLKPYEACLLQDGATIAFGASSRTYRLCGVAAAAPKRDRDEGEEEYDAKESLNQKRGKMHPKKWEKKKRRWLNGPKKNSQMTENERVAMQAGSSSGIMGPGEW